MSTEYNKLYGFLAKPLEDFKKAVMYYDGFDILSYAQKNLKDNIMSLTAQNNYSKSRLSLRKFVSG